MTVIAVKDFLVERTEVNSRALEFIYSYQSSSTKLIFRLSVQDATVKHFGFTSKLNIKANVKAQLGIGDFSSRKQLLFHGPYHGDVSDFEKIEAHLNREGLDPLVAVMLAHELNATFKHKVFSATRAFDAKLKRASRAAEKTKKTKKRY